MPKPTLADLRERLEALKQFADVPDKKKAQEASRKRGNEFEYWLCDLFIAVGLDAQGPFNRDNEQIDGSILYRGRTYLIEAKWHKNRKGRHPIDSLARSVNRGVSQTSGLCISYSGFSKEGINTAQGPGNDVDVFLIDADHLTALLNGKISGPVWLDRLNHLASRTTKRYIPIAEILATATPTPQPTPTDQPNGGPRVSLSRLPNTSGGALFGREAEPARLDAAWRDPATRILSLVAWGGVGKTALTHRWLTTMADRGWAGARRVYAWSFYSQGAGAERQSSADLFLSEALAWFGDPDPKAGDPWAKGERLAALLAAEPTLLVLDGLEPLQHASEAVLGQFKDPGVKAMLKELARTGQGLCLISSRLPLSDLSDHEADSAPRLPLAHLTSEAGGALLRHLGVTGSAAELERVAEDYKGHALALNLLGRYLKAVYGGDVLQRDKIPALLTEHGLGGHARRVMRRHEEMLADSAEADILRLLGLFDRPAEVGAVAALRAEPPIAGLTDRLAGLDEVDWGFTLDHLRELGLLGPARDDGALDCHPLVREHFAAVLAEAATEAFRAGHDRLYDYYRGLPKKRQPDSLAEMEPLFRAVHHGCRAGRHQHALDEVYWPRIRREKEAYTVKKLGAFGADLAALAGFFDRPWREPAAGLPPIWQAVVLNWAGFRLRALGRLHEAAQPMDASIELLAGQEDWKQAGGAAGNLSELYLTLGRVADAVVFARRALAFADQSKDHLIRMYERTVIGEALLQADEREEAAELFSQAEAIQQEWQPEYPLLYSQAGYRYCDLLLSQGQAQQAHERATQMLAWEEEGWVLDIALDHLSLGRAAWQLGCSEEAAGHLERAVTGLRQAGQHQELPRGLLARAAYRRRTGDAPGAARDLAEAREIAQRGDMGLWLVDIALEATQQTQDAGQRQAHLAEAQQHIQTTGYKRRLPLLQALQNGQDPPVGSGML